MIRNQAADLSGIDTWLFDLDNTLYPHDSGVMALVERRMTLFVMAELDLEEAEARSVQKTYYHKYGTNLAGLIAHHNTEPDRFLAEVHDVDLGGLDPDLQMRSGLQRLPGRRLVFTNGSAGHAHRVLDRLGIADLFDDVFHIEAADYLPKPAMQTFHRMMTSLQVKAADAAFFEDSEKNLAPAFELGMTTILVGPHAAQSDADFIDHRTHDLPRFLLTASISEPRP